jgi:hypothetical protein
MGRQQGLCALTPVLDGKAPELRAQLHALPRGHGSPLARVEGTHFARWVVIDLEGEDGEPLTPPRAYLLFASEFDGPLKPYVRTLCETLGTQAHAIWSHCKGCPETLAELPGYLLAHRIVPGYSVVAYPDASVEHVRSSLALTERLNEFHIHAGGLRPPELQRAWVESFRRDPERGQ